MQRVYKENEWGKVSKRIVTLSIYVIFASHQNLYAVQWENRGPINKI